MELKIECKQDYYDALANMLRAVIPGMNIVKGAKDDVEYLLKVDVLSSTAKNLAVAKLKRYKKLILRHEESFLIEDEEKKARREKKQLKIASIELFNQYFGYNINPWGILTGVRPTKLANQLLEQGLNYKQLDERLESEYRITKDKRELVIDVIKKERKVLTNKKLTPRQLGIYIGIPFCPSKCSYCSFASYPIEKFKTYLKDFLTALHFELKELGSLIRELDLEINTIYLGGGTPTVLNEVELTRLLAKLNEFFPSKQEFTVEAGRIDTITEAKLKRLKEFNVNRICINPQTMNQSTLKDLNRNHSPAQIKKTINLARKIGFETINMDLIIGLPNEGLAEIENTVNKVLNLAPENITLHALAYKRAAKLKDKKELAKIKVLRKAYDLVRKRVANSGLTPYYMYRQKQTVGNLENIGYAKEGDESIYNIAMIEENQSIIAFGGGGITKLLNPESGRFERIVNPRNPAQYIKRVEDKIAEKKFELTTLF